MSPSSSMLFDPYALGLQVARIRGNEALCVCPFHDDHKPSSSFNVKSGLFICFACGTSATAARLAKKMGTEIQLVKASELPLTTGSERPDREEWDWALRCDLAKKNKYLRSRDVTDAEVEKYDIRQYEHGIIFILKDPLGVAVGAQIRFSDETKAKIRYMTLGEKPMLWPFHIKDLNHKNEAILVEGNFAAIRARKFEANAFSVIGVGSAYNSAKQILSFRNKIAVFDDDDAGHRAAMFLMMKYKGFSAYAPGIEADETTAAFWKQLPELVVDSPYDFAEIAEAKNIYQNLAQKVYRL